MKDSGLDRQSDNDRGKQYAWVILAVLFIGLVVSFGMRASFGAYISSWEQDFSSNRSIVTSISMLSFFVFAFGQPLAGKLNEHFGKSFVPSISVFLMGASLVLTSLATQIWQVFILYGVVFSLGVAGCCSVIAAAVITNWFVEKRGFALGLVMSGLGVGQLVLIPASLFMIGRMGWRDTISTLSLVIMIIVAPLFIFLLRSRPEEKGLKPYGYSEPANTGHDESRKIPDKIILPIAGIFRLKAFWLLSTTYFVCGFTDVGMIQTHLIPLVELKGLPLTAAAIAFSLIAIFNIIGTIVTGHLSDHFRRNRQLAVIYLIRAGTYVFLIFLRSQWQLFVFAVINGSVDMASIAPTNSLAVQLFDKYSTGMILGLIAISHQVGGAIGSWLPGLFFDLTGSYFTALIFSVFLLIGAGLTALRIPDAVKPKDIA